MNKYKRKEEKEEKRERPLIYLKRKLMAALSMLLVAAILLTATSYAWLVLSIAPEVTGITTNVGANGSLEIALLTADTYKDLSKIPTGPGTSLANGESPNVRGNISWGNLVDLSVKDYGLSEVMLLPARLSVAPSGDGYVVNNGLLSVPTYGYDGRIIQLTDNTVTTTYSGDGKFTYEGFQDYGVRVIGTSDSISVQEAALTQAKASIKTYTESARSAAVAALNDNTDGLISIIAEKMGMGLTIGNKGKAETINSMIDGLENSVSYIDLAIRNGIVAVAASKLADEVTFTTVRDHVMNTDKSLNEVIDGLTGVGYADTLPEEFTNWVGGVSDMANSLALANNLAAELTDESPWEDIRGALEPLMNTSKVYVNNVNFDNLTKADFEEMLNGGEVRLVLTSGSGVFADIADYTGDYSTLISILTYAVSFSTLTNASPVYLEALYAATTQLSAAGGNAGGALETFDLTSTFGYALDLAFRCNAANADLLLQTDGVQRVYEDSTAGATMGGGSYMEFATKDSGFPLAKMIELMDAVRVAFIDDQGNLLGIAKLNTSNRSVVDGVAKAPLYLYDYSFDEEGVLIMGERQKDTGGQDGQRKNFITNLEQNIAKAVSVVVWLDGDIVDNTKVSATQEASLYGVLNLQFATSADLVPAANGGLKEMITDTTDLTALVDQYKSTYEAGQQLYTTLSWDAFISAYNLAFSVANDPNADKADVSLAAEALRTAGQALARVSHDALKAQIQIVRDLMGETEDLARIVSKNYESLDSYTQEQFDAKAGEIYRVDYKKNLRDEGNNVYTPVYTDDSWIALATLLYDAELVDMNPNSTDAQLDAAISSLDLKKLEHKVYFLPYEYNGQIYYYAIPTDPADTDTYGKWYDSSLKRIVADLTILTLDAQAEPTSIAYISQGQYVPNYEEYGYNNITPYINIDSARSQALADEEVIAVQWNLPSGFVPGITDEQKTVLVTLRQQVNELSAGVEIAGSEWEPILEELGKVSYSYKLDDDSDEVYWRCYPDATWADAQAVIDTVQDFVDKKLGMTEEQHLALTELINSAKAIEGYETDGSLADLRDAVAAAQALVDAFDAKEVVSRSEPAKAAEDLQFLLATIGEKGVTLLNAAVNRAKAVAGYDDPAPTEPAGDADEQTRQENLTKLRAGVAAAELLLAQETPDTSLVQKAITELNKLLKDLGYVGATEYNTLTYVIPMGSEHYELVYVVDRPSINLIRTEVVVDDILSAVVLTKGGIAFVVETPISLYSPAHYVTFDEFGDMPEGATYSQEIDKDGYVVDTWWNGDMYAGETVDFYAWLVSRQVKKLDENGEVVKDEDGYTVYVDVPHTEEIVSWSWASDNTDVFTVDNPEAAEPTITAVAPGSATLSLTVVTRQGNWYGAVHQHLTVKRRPEDTEALQAALSGKTLSILGDGISTYSGISNGTDVNDTLGSNETMLSGDPHYVDSYLKREETWWDQAAVESGLSLLVNNSSTGSVLVSNESQNIRSVNLHDNTLANNSDGLDIDPDVIAVFTGTDDLIAANECGVNFDSSFYARVEGSDFVGTTFDEAYARMLYNARNRYPDADIYCFTLPVWYSWVSIPASVRDAYNIAITTLAEHYGCTLVDLNHTALRYDCSCYTYIGHLGWPNEDGMEIISDEFVNTLLERYVNQ